MNCYAILQLNRGLTSFDVRLSQTPFSSGNGRKVEIKLAAPYITEMFTAAESLKKEGNASTSEIALLSGTDERSDKALAEIMTQVFTHWNNDN